MRDNASRTIGVVPADKLLQVGPQPMTVAKAVRNHMPRENIVRQVTQSVTERGEKCKCDCIESSCLQGQRQQK
jgi:hypothetical protein